MLTTYCFAYWQAFRQKQLLKRHQNLYHNPEYIPPMPREKTQECPECGKAFRHKGEDTSTIPTATIYVYVWNHGGTDPVDVFFWVWSLITVGFCDRLNDDNVHKFSSPSPSFYHHKTLFLCMAGNLIRHMAIHDPDASAQEKAQALKIGRQKRLQLINGQQVGSARLV